MHTYTQRSRPSGYLAIAAAMAMALSSAFAQALDPSAETGPGTNIVIGGASRVIRVRSDSLLKVQGKPALDSARLTELLSTNTTSFQTERTGPQATGAGAASAGSLQNNPLLGPGSFGMLVNSHILNVDFGNSTKVGLAAVGQSTSDYWNPFLFPGLSQASVPNLLWSDSVPSPADITVANAPGYWGNMLVADPMYHSFIYPTGGGQIVVSVSELPAGNYDFFVYAVRGAVQGAPIIELQVNGVTFWTKGTTIWGDGWSSSYWDEHEQYVRFRNIQVPSGTVVLNVSPASAGLASLSGLQIVPSALLNEPPGVTQLLNVDFGGQPMEKTGFAAVGLSQNDFWNCDSHPGQQVWTMSALKWSDQTASAANLQVLNGPGFWGVTMPDPMLGTYMYSADAGSVRITLSGLPAGTCDLYLYGHTPNPDDNAVFQLWSDDIYWGIKGTSLIGAGPANAAWEVGQQYVLFRDVTIREGKPLIIDAKATTYGFNNVGGFQVAYTGPLDSDADGLPDGWERRWFNGLVQSAPDDPDVDGLSNLREYELGTDPGRSDSNANGISDLYEFETVWVEDAVPQGALQDGYSEWWDWSADWWDGDGWGGQDVYPYSGVWFPRMHVSDNVFNDVHHHSFTRANEAIRVRQGDILYAYINLDSSYPPSEIMLQWYAMGDDGNGSWEHRAFWGADLIALGTSGTESRQRIGDLPQAGQWLRLQVPASAVGLEGKIVEGMSFTLHGGRAAWDRTGTMIMDRDGDALPDWWEMQHFGNLAQNAGGDPDADGFSNIEEFEQNTGPMATELTATAWKSLGDDTIAIQIRNVSGQDLSAGRFDLFIYPQGAGRAFYRILMPWETGDVMPNDGSRVFTFCTPDPITDWNASVRYQNPNLTAMSPRFQINVRESIARVYRNTTQVQNPCSECQNCEETDPIPPYERPQCDEELLVRRCQPIPCDPWPNPLPVIGGPAGQALDNFYAPSEPEQQVSLSRPKKGFKNVYAIKQWHGRWGFNSHEPDRADGGRVTDFYKGGDCRSSDPRGLPDARKYLHIDADAKVITRTINIGVGITTNTARCTRSSTVGQVSGKQTFGGTDEGQGDGLDKARNLAMKFAENCSTSMLLDLYADQLFEYCIDPFELSYQGNGGAWTATIDRHEFGVFTISVDLDAGTFIHHGEEGWNHKVDETLSISATKAEYTRKDHYVVEINCREDEVTQTLVVNLAEPYDSSAVDRDCDLLLAQWDLLDDLQYPWRTDASPTRGPLVTYNERPMQRPSLDFALENVGTPEAPNWQPPVDASLPPWRSQVDEVILGAPLPARVNGELRYYEPYFNFYHLNYVFETSQIGKPEAFIESHGASSPFPFATQWIDDELARLLPEGPFWAYGANSADHFTFRLRNPFLVDPTQEWEHGGIASCLIKCKWAEVVDPLQPPSKQFLFREWTFNFRDFIESYHTCDQAYQRNNVENPFRAQSNMELCPALGGCAPVRFSPLSANYANGDFIGLGSWWTTGLNCRLLAYNYDCCQPAVYVQPVGSPSLVCPEMLVQMPAAICDERYGSLWMGRIDQSTADAAPCASYLANLDSGSPNPPALEPQINLELRWHQTAQNRGSYEIFVAPRPVHPSLSINSLDRYIEVKIPEASVEALGGVGKVGLRLQSATEGYEIPSLGDATVYEPRKAYPVAILEDNGASRGSILVKEGPLFPESELQFWDPNTVFPAITVIREGGFYRFFTVFDNLGEVTVSLTADKQVVESSVYQLTSHPDMAELISDLDRILLDSRTRGMPQGGPGILAIELSSAHQNRSLIARCCSAVFEKVERAVSAGVVLYAEGVKIAIIGAQGFAQGFWSGLKNDKDNVTQLYALIRHPVETSKAMYEGFRGLVNMGWEGLKQIPKKMLEEYLTQAQKSISWLDPEGEDRVALIAYTVGYSAGFLAEQILVSSVAGIFKAAVALPLITSWGGKVAAMMSAVKVGQKILGAVDGAVGTVQYAAAQVQKAKNLAVKSATQFVKEKTGLDELDGLVKSVLLDGCP